MSTSNPAYCWYNNDASSYKDIYGALYNVYTVQTAKLCPAGWRVPSHSDWTDLYNYLRNNEFNYDDTIGENKVAKSIASPANWMNSSVTGAVGNTEYPEKGNISGFSGELLFAF